MKNKELFAKDPLALDLLNEGVSRVTNAGDANEEKVARFELQTFVCDGQYAVGLTRILRSFLAHLDKPEQAAAWVSGFFGSGKSHLVKMLRFLWTNHKFADGATARSLATSCSRSWTPKQNATAVSMQPRARWVKAAYGTSEFPC